MRWRLIAAFVGVTIVILAAQNIPLARYLKTVETERMVAGIHPDAFILGGASEDALAAGNPQAQADLQTSISFRCGDPEEAEAITAQAMTAYVSRWSGEQTDRDDHQLRAVT